jgi:hypothetical protein
LGFFCFSPTITTLITSCGDDTYLRSALSYGQINNERKNARRMMSVKQTSNTQLYEIRLKGQLDARWMMWFDGLTITLEEDGSTLLTGPVVDQAALHGLLKRVRDLGIPLISVSPYEPSQADQSDVE